MTERVEGLGRRVAKGAAWVIFTRMALRVIGFVSTIILARLLVPEDFGLVAIATMIAGLLEVLSEFNFAIYLIQRQDADRSYYDTAWTLTVIRGVCLGAALAIGAPYASQFFDRTELEGICYCLAAALVVSGFVNVGIVDFRKNLQFDREFRFMLYARLVSFAITLTLAWIMRSYWALVVGIMSGHVARSLLSYAMHHYRPRFSLSRVAEILAFSKWLLFNQGLVFASRRADVLVVGKVAGAASVGLYTVGQEIAMLASSELVMPIHRALLPGYAKLADDPPALKRAYIDGLALILMLAMPVAAGIAVTAEPLVAVLLGAKWTGSVPLIQILVISGILQLLRANSHPMLIAMGKPHLTTALAASVAVTTIPLLVWWTPIAGAQGAAWAVTAGTAVSVALNLAIVVTIAKTGVGEISKAVWRSLASTFIMFMAMHFGMSWIETTAAPLVVVLGISVLIGILSYAGGHLLLWCMAGRPAGSERYVIRAIEDALS